MNLVSPETGLIRHMAIRGGRVQALACVFPSARRLSASAPLLARLSSIRRTSMTVATQHHRSIPTVWNDRDAAFYSEHLAASNYVERVGGRLLAELGPQQDLLDIGAGSGILGRHLLAPGAQWTAVEPNAYMRGCIQRLAAQAPSVELNLHNSLWQDLGKLDLVPADTLLCANIPVADGQAETFLQQIRPLAKRTLVWNLPAQEGPRTYCLSGFLPAQLHRSDMTPGYQLTLDELSPGAQPNHILFTDWAFSTLFATPEAALMHFREKLGALDGAALGLLERHLQDHLQATPGGWLASAPKRAASLIWQA